jgi:hypothetical protein
MCCRNGRPGVGKEEVERIQAQLPRILPMLRPAARRVIEEDGIASRRLKEGKQMVRVADGWCLFFNNGCVLHTIGIEDGNSYLYKPDQCALFPLEKNDDGEWYVRQWGYEDEEWDLFCLNPRQSKMPAATSLQVEVELAARISEASAQRNGVASATPCLST